LGEILPIAARCFAEWIAMIVEGCPARIAFFLPAVGNYLDPANRGFFGCPIREWVPQNMSDSEPAKDPISRWPSMDADWVSRICPRHTAGGD
jgi:hypothetical protein